MNMQSFKNIGSVLFGIGLLAGCATKRPPPSDEIRQQGLTNITVPSVWKAGGKTGGITDDWLATFNDEELERLVREAIANNPDLRITATKVEQAEHYVRLARAAMRPSIAL